MFKSFAPIMMSHFLLVIKRYGFPMTLVQALSLRSSYFFLFHLHLQILVNTMHEKNLSRSCRLPDNSNIVVLLHQISKCSGSVYKFDMEKY